MGSSNLPPLPGIYIFKKNTDILYVGKAKNLKKRVASYFHNKVDDWKITALLAEYTHIEHIVTHSEPEALLLEAQLIRDHDPKYNILLKSGQPFVYLLFTHEALPNLELVRNKSKKGFYFGPFLHKKQARSVHHYLIKTFRLQSCKKKIPQGCLDYHIGNCSGTCLETFDNADYIFRIELAKKLLRGHYKESLKALEQQIEQYSQEFHFEKAKRLHQYLQNLEVIFETLKAKFSEDKYSQEIFAATDPLWHKVHDYQLVSVQAQKRFGLSKAPSTIDCFDVSHFQSKQLVGSCIRFANGIPDKNKFRRFIIKTLDQQNDYAALQEIVSRRYKDVTQLPDLIIIDGGKGQLNAIKTILPDFKDCISIAKREERVFCPANAEGVVLNLQDEVGQLIIALRDYAHHFAIEFHRLRRKKQHFL